MAAFKRLVAAGRHSEAAALVAIHAPAVERETTVTGDLGKLQRWLGEGAWAADVARFFSERRNAELADAQRDRDRLPPELREKAGVTVVKVESDQRDREKFRPVHETDPADGCLACGNRDADELLWDDGGEISCAKCGAKYRLPRGGSTGNQSDDNREALDRLGGIKDELAELVEEAMEIVRDLSQELGDESIIDAAKGYWFASMKMALDDDHEFLGKSGHSMEDTCFEIEMALDEQQSEEVAHGE